MSVIAKQSFQSPNRRQAAIAEHQAILDAVRACSGRDDLTAYGALRDPLWRRPGTSCSGKILPVRKTGSMPEGMLPVRSLLMQMY